MEGCLLINLDEMPVDQGNTKSISDKLKGLITEPFFDCRDMYKISYKQVNTFNFIITTNNDAINFTQSNNERYVSTDIDESMKGNTEYFTKINEAIDNIEVQQAFYNDMVKRFDTLKDWN
jgi:DNA-directed RNA polymerase specialized sigma54-like protein